MFHEIIINYPEKYIITLLSGFENDWITQSKINSAAKIYSLLSHCIGLCVSHVVMFMHFICGNVSISVWKIKKHNLMHIELKGFILLYSEQCYIIYFQIGA